MHYSTRCCYISMVAGRFKFRDIQTPSSTKRAVEPVDPASARDGGHVLAARSSASAPPSSPPVQEEGRDGGRLATASVGSNERARYDVAAVEAIRLDLHALGLEERRQVDVDHSVLRVDLEGTTVEIFCLPDLTVGVDEGCQLEVGKLGTRAHRPRQRRAGAALSRLRSDRLSEEHVGRVSGRA